MYVVEYDWFSVAGCLREAYVPRNHRSEYLRAEEAPEVGGDLLGERGTIVIHSEQDALDGKCRVNRAAKAHQCVEQFGDALHGVILALNRHDDRVAGRERVNGKEIEGWRAIDENVVVVLANGLNEVFKLVFASFHADELDGGTDKIFVCRNEVQAGNLGLEDDSGGRFVQDDGMVNRASSGILRESEAASRVSLRIRVYEERALFFSGQRGTEIDGRGGFSHAALLICDGNDSAHAIAPEFPGRI